MGAAFGVFLGVAQTVEFGWGLRRFGGMEYVPRVVALTTVRALGAGAAMLVTVVTAAVTLHRAGRARPGETVARDRRLAWLAAATLATFVVVASLAIAGGAVTSGAFFGLGPRAYVREGVDTLLMSDVAHGAALAAVDALVATGFIAWVGPWMHRSPRALVLKLLVAYLAVQATALGEQEVMMLLAR